MASVPGRVESGTAGSCKLGLLTFWCGQISRTNCSVASQLPTQRLAARNRRRWRFCQRESSESIRKMRPRSPPGQLAALYNSINLIAGQGLSLYQSFSYGFDFGAICRNEFLCEPFDSRHLAILLLAVKAHLVLQNVVETTQIIFFAVDDPSTDEHRLRSEAHSVHHKHRVGISEALPVVTGVAGTFFACQFVDTFRINSDDLHADPVENGAHDVACLVEGGEPGQVVRLHSCFVLSSSFLSFSFLAGPRHFCSVSHQELQHCLSTHS